MKQAISVKICGLSDPEHVATAADAGAAYVGFVFFPKSPRHVSFEQARALALATPVGMVKVALTVNADDPFLDQLVADVPLDMLQLHGAETPERVVEIKARYGLPVMKAIGVADRTDLHAIDTYSAVADQLLIDAKPPKDADLPGGNGLSFDWTVLRDRKYWTKPWMLAGGLTPSNVADAIRLTGARQVDVSSGVESASGVKDSRLIAEFLSAAREEPAPKLA
ncbi:MAG: phosphoribosylanthranilate isomerase [Pseudomonadota bacterium]